MVELPVDGMQDEVDGDAVVMTPAVTTLLMLLVIKMHLEYNV